MTSLLTLALAALQSQSTKPAKPFEEERPDMAPAIVRHVKELPHRATPPRNLAIAPYVAHQVNVDGSGNNIVGDAANEPSICVDPTNPLRIAIGWRQFDSIASNFRQAGHAFSVTGGLSWVNNGPFTPGTFRSDPILASNSSGKFFYDSLTDLTANDIWLSNDGGASWGGPNYAYGGDKTWLTVDKGAGSPGNGTVYICWSAYYSSVSGRQFSRSSDGGNTFSGTVPIPLQPTFGTVATFPNGDVAVAGSLANGTGLAFARAYNPWVPQARVRFDTRRYITQTYDIGPSTRINPDGLCGQVWLEVAPLGSPYPNHVYVLATIGGYQNQPDSIAMFKSTDGGFTWSSPIKVHTNMGTSTSAYHWFGTLSVAPNGRLDVVYNDTGLDANQSAPTTCVTVYRYSNDDGVTWSTPIQLTQPWAFGVGYPQQNKIGDYYHMVSDNAGVHLAFAATFNGEQDVYYMRIPYPGP